MLFCIGRISYDEANLLEWCADHKDIDERNGCASDEKCLSIGRTKCDKDPLCFGVAWYENRIEQPLKICKSNVMKRQPGAWRTMMKQGMLTLSL